MSKNRGQSQRRKLKKGNKIDTFIISKFIEKNLPVKTNIKDYFSSFPNTFVESRHPAKAWKITQRKQRNAFKYE